MNETKSIQNFKILFGDRFMGISTSLVILIGLLLNSMSFYIYSKPAFNKSSAVVYLKALCVLDTVTVIQNIHFITASFGYDPKSLNIFFCKFLWFFAYFTCSSSSFLEAFISLDRCLSVAFLNRFKILSKKWFQYSMICGLVIFNAALYSPMLHFYGMEDQLDPETNQTIVGSCKSSSVEYTLIFGWMDLINSTLVLFTIMFVSSIITIRCLVLSRKRSKNDHHITQAHRIALK